MKPNLALALYAFAASALVTIAFIGFVSLALAHHGLGG